jgi:hypothetical protein
MLTRYKMIVETIVRTLVLPRSLSFDPVETMAGEGYSSFNVEFLNVKFSIFLSNTGYQVIVTNKDKIVTLVIVHQEWDSVVIGQIISQAIQKWIDSNLYETIIEIGAYGYKLKTIHRTGVFVFISIEFYNQDNTVYSERKQLFSIHSIIGKKCILLIDLIAHNDIVDLTLIPTLNNINPANPITIMDEYKGVIEELDHVIKYVMLNNYAKFYEKN